MIFPYQHKGDVSHMLPEAKIYQVNKKPLNHVIVKREEDRMFQAFIESGLNSYSPGQLSFNWFIRDVELSLIHI